jgi:hypothetical protein
MCRPPAGQPGPQGRECVVGQEPGPRQVPQSRGDVGVVPGAEQRADGVRERPEEVGAATGERVEHRAVQLARLELGIRIRQSQRREVGRVQRHPPVVAGQ